MNENKKWWTLQLVPHGKGNVKHFKIRFFPIITTVVIFLFILISGLGISYYLWNETKVMDVRLDDQLQELSQYKTENQKLKQNITHLNKDLAEIHNEVLELQDWLKEVELLEQQLRELDSSSLHQEEIHVEKPLTLRISSSHTEEAIPQSSSSIEQVRSRIDQIKANGEQQQLQLAELVTHIETEQYLALFIPSIPPSNGRVSSPFGIRKDPFTRRNRMHDGIDFANSFRSPIVATANGTVSFAGRNGGYGKQVVIDHGNGYTTSYSHLTSISVEKGDQVERNDEVGKMGSTGRSTGVHLHYEIHKDGNPVNPMPYIKGGS
jgi:murein DD-endopeptidase MepM/ murein hydrolase activator NlpD